MIEWVSFAFVGVFAGITAGLLGLGGGIIMVPSLLYLFKTFGMDEQHLMHMAVGTSLMAIIVTSFSSIIAHQRYGNVNWVIVRRFFMGLVLGGFGGAYIASSIPSYLLQQIFAIYALIMSIHLWFSSSNFSKYSRLLKPSYLSAIGSVVGSVSVLVGMGGGTIIVPYLLLAGQNIQRSIGTSSACALPIAISGVLGFIIFSEQQPITEEWQTSFFHWKAFLGLISTSMFFGPLAVKNAKYLPIKLLERIFSLVLVSVSVSLFFG